MVIGNCNPMPLASRTRWSRIREKEVYPVNVASFEDKFAAHTPSPAKLARPF